MTSATAQGMLEGSSRTPLERTLIDVFRSSVAEFPDALALEDPQGGISYRRLERLVYAQAIALTREGVRRGDKVGIRIASGTRELYVSILAVLAAGAAYVPVDADDPEERAQLVFGEARVVGIIGDGESSNRRSPSLSKRSPPKGSPSTSSGSEAPPPPPPTTTRGSSSPPVRPACPRASP